MEFGFLTRMFLLGPNLVNLASLMAAIAQFPLWETFWIFHEKSCKLTQQPCESCTGPKT